MASAPITTAAAGHDVRGMFDRIAHRYDAANRAMSVGVDIMWRRKALKPLLAGLGATPAILDLGAGTLDGAIEIARQCAGARVAGADFSRQMLRVGCDKLVDGLGARIAAHGADGHHLPYRDAAFDAAFSAFCVRNLARLPVALAEVRRVVKPGGPVVILEFFKPSKTRFFFDKFWNARVLPLVGWAVSGDRDAYRYLPSSIDAFVSRGGFESALRTAGFSDVTGQDLFPSGVASMVVAR